MVKRTICCPSCGENIVIKEKKESIMDLNIEMAKRMWAEWEKKPDSEKVEELEKTKKEFALNMTATNNKVGKFNKEVESILNSKKKPWVKKLTLFNLIKDLPVGESPEEKEKNNHLLESYLFTEFAKRSMKEYKKAESSKHS